MNYLKYANAACFFAMILFAAKPVHADSPSALAGVVVEQITFNSAHTGFIPASEYAHVIIYYPPAPVLLQRFLNMYFDLGNGPVWAIQNMPLLDGMIVGPGLRGPSTLVDLTQLGVSRGTDLAGVPFFYGFSFSNDPVAEPPPFVPKGSGVIGRRVYRQGGANVAGVPGIGLNGPNKEPLKPPYDGGTNKEWAWRHNLDSFNKDVGHNQCGPAAITISLLWLAKQYPDHINLGTQSFYEVLAKVKEDIPNFVEGEGVWDDEIIRGKLKFFQRTDKTIAPGWQVKYQGGIGNKNSKGQAQILPAWIQEGALVARKKGATPTFEFLKNELAAGEDVELVVDYLHEDQSVPACMTNDDCTDYVDDEGNIIEYFCSGGRCYTFTGAHVMAVRGFLKHGNKAFLWTTDDAEQDPFGHKPSDSVPPNNEGLRHEQLQQVIVGGPNDGPLNGYMYLTGEGGLNRVRFVVSESPPEPGKPVVYDTVYSSIPGTNFSAGVWTKDGIPIGKTFAGGVTPLPGVPQTDSAVLPEQPNDWHWSVTFTLFGTDYIFNVDIQGFGPNDAIEVEVVACGAIPVLTLEVDKGLNFYDLLDENGFIIHSAPWSGYPENIPNFCGTTGSVRNSAPASCTQDVDCFDQNTCTCDRCVAGACQNTPTLYGNADCTGIVEVGDVLCVLAGYAGYENCPNGDLAPPCTGDGIIEVSDVLAVLSAYTGGDPCNCPG